MSIFKNDSKWKIQTTYHKNVQFILPNNPFVPKNPVQKIKKIWCLVLFQKTWNAASCHLFSLACFRSEHFLCFWFIRSWQLFLFGAYLGLCKFCLGIINYKNSIFFKKTLIFKTFFLNKCYFFFILKKKTIFRKNIYFLIIINIYKK